MEATIKKTEPIEKRVSQPVEMPTHTRVVIPPHAWLHEMVDRECSRYALIAIKFDFVGGRVLATDDRIAASASVPELKGLASDSVMLHVECFERAVRYIKRETRNLDLVLVRDNRPSTGDLVRWSFEVHNCIGNVQASFPAEFVEGRFPDMDQVVKPIDPDTPKSMLDPLMLRRISNVFQKISYEKATIDVRLDVFSHPFTSTPWRFRATGCDKQNRSVCTDFVVMPLAPDRVEAQHPNDPTAKAPTSTLSSVVVFIQVGEAKPVVVGFENSEDAIQWATAWVRTRMPELYYGAFGEVMHQHGVAAPERVWDMLQSRMPSDWLIRIAELTTPEAADQG